MLTADLVQAKLGRTHVEPRYIRTDRQENVDLAASLIDIFERNHGERKRDLESELAELLGNGTEFLLHRGLAKLLLDRCEFETQADVDPVEFRRRVFEASARAYGATGAGSLDRAAVLEKLGSEFGCSAAHVEQALYADLKDEQVLATFKSCSPPWLLERYNVGLAQAVLLRASELFIEVRGETTAGYRELFRRIKFFRLLYQIEGNVDVGYRIQLDGPGSVLKSSQRYGLQMAMFLPGLLHCKDWELEAEVLWGPKRHRRLFQLTSKQGLEPHSSAKGQWVPEEITWFEGQFQKLKTDWCVSRDTEIVDLGGQGILIPDFVFTHPPSGRKAHMEILGFWRKGSVASRLELLSERGPDNLILAVSKELHVGEGAFDDLPGQVYVFRSSPVARKVLELLDAIQA